MGELGDAIDEVRIALADAGPEIFPDLATIEKQGSTVGTSSDTPGWIPQVTDWPCKFETRRETTGAREDVDGGLTQSYSYTFTGPYVRDGESLFGVIKKGMRIRVDAHTVQPELICDIEDVAADGIFLKLVARATD